MPQATENIFANEVGCRAGMLDDYERIVSNTEVKDNLNNIISNR